jgi:hypothetical protein
VRVAVFDRFVELALAPDEPLGFALGVFDSPARATMVSQRPAQAATAPSNRSSGRAPQTSGAGALAAISTGRTDVARADDSQPFIAIAHRTANTAITHATGPIDTMTDMPPDNGPHIASRGGHPDGGELITNGILNVPRESP